MTISPDLTVGELAAAHPSALRVLDRAGIDYCCGGKRRVAEACTKAGLSIDELASRIEAAEAEPAGDVDWTAAPIADLVDHIEATHHAFTRSELDRVRALIAKVVRAHGDAHGELHELHDLFEELADELLAHMAKEERVLFPRIRELAATGPSLALELRRGLVAPIDVMEVEHETCDDILGRMREVAGGYAPPAGACGSFRALYAALDALERDLHVHVNLESNVLYPRALQGTP